MGTISNGVTGIQVAQMGLQTASHNITNASTPGFNRQRSVQASNIALATGAGFVGQGAHVSTVDRMYSSFLNSQVSTAQSKVSELDSYYAQLSQIDNMLADTNTGMSPALQDFFTGVQQVVANPSQLPARQAMVSSAQALISRFQGLNDQLSQMYDGVNSQITSTVSSINSYATEIGSLNQQIIIAESSVNQPANDLLDQRDQLVFELNKLISVSTFTNSDGSLNVFIGTGQQLVVNTQVSKISALPSSADSSRFTVWLPNAGGSQELPEQFINGGSLGGLLRFRSESLDSVANKLGNNAASLALTFNAQNALGQDLLGQSAMSPAGSTFQANFFSIPTPTVIANANNNKLAPADITATLSVPTSVANSTSLTNADYQLAFNGTNYTLTRSTDNHQWSAASVNAMADSTGSIFSATEGFTLTENAAKRMATNDSFKIEPTRAGVQNLTLNSAIVADPRLIAAAAPVRTQAATGNTGVATISAGKVATGYSAAVAAAPITLTYNTNTSPASTPPVPNLTGFPVAVSVTVPGTPPITTDYPFPVASVPYVSGATITLVGSNASIPPGGFSFEISGSPNNGDKFTISKNSGAVSDGRNALALGQLQTQNTMSGQTATYQSAYAQLVSETGNKTREIQVTGASQQSLLDQTTAAQQSLSGVNLDEEAANLIRFQQAYQASAKVIEIGSKLFDVLLALRA
ncbi:flagellar hook-associated protein FlgK [Propionivibrio sp.]|uniref:flagellar hook-associated protein FlgK n=1 Tax=Propionivibrio sp. TaxID=2212460 RepID=UPI003BF24910